MKFFLDTADVTAIKNLVPTGLVDGVTTNPSLIAKSGGDIRQVLQEICEIVEGPVSAEVTALDYEGMVKEAESFLPIGPNIIIKVPLTPDGLRACKTLADKGVKVNVTLCFSPGQALLAAKAGAAFISPFLGRLDDIGHDGMDVVAQIVGIYGNFPNFKTKILAASIRHTLHVVEAARIGVDVITVPPKVLEQLYKHPLTDKGIDAFLADWNATGQSIL